MDVARVPLALAIAVLLPGTVLAAPTLPGPRPAVGKPPKLDPPKKPTAVSCGQVATVRPVAPGVRLRLARGDDDLDGKGEGVVRVRARFTDTRIVVSLEHEVVERSGDTRLRGTGSSDLSFFGQESLAEIGRLSGPDAPPAIPNGCEIASISLTEGELHAPSRAGGVVSGSGLIESATCSDNGICHAVVLRPIQVKFRPQDGRCDPIRIDPFPLTVWDSTPAWSSSRGGAPIDDLVGDRTYNDKEMGDARPAVEIQVWVHPNHTGSHADLTAAVILESARNKLNGKIEVPLFRAEQDAFGCKIDRKKAFRIGGTYEGQTRDKPNHKGTGYGFPGSANAGTRTGIVEGAYCVTDSDGTDNGRVGCAEIHLRSFFLPLVEDVEPTPSGSTTTKLPTPARTHSLGPIHEK